MTVNKKNHDEKSKETAETVTEGDLVRVEILGLAATGKGVAAMKKGEFTAPVFVEYSCPGDVINARIIKKEKKYYEAEIANFVQQSQQRVIAKCKHYQICGACNLLHINYAAQISEKVKILRFLLEKKEIGFSTIKTIIDDKQYNYKDKARFYLRIDNGKSLCGFMKRKSNEIVKVEECLIVNKKILALIQLLNITAFDKQINDAVEISAAEDMIEHKLVLHFSLESGSYLLTNAFEHFFDENKELIKGVNIQVKKKTKRIGDYSCKYKYNNITYSFLPETFSQGNFQTNQKLVSVVSELCGKGKELLELYAGFGNFTLQLAKHFERITAVEGEYKSVHFGLENIELNKIKNVKFVNKDVETFLESKFGQSNCILLDPPRDGCSSFVLDKISKHTERIVYVSCNPTALARDLLHLNKNNFFVSEIYLVDMFAQTNHFEIVVKMEKKK
ncbi:23S rRNA (uracil(1939)-C(5))-methyltransferase RlmD [Candidatus Woesearchaeota archaeon]|nr:23S rRNA (uracil(1939)-C(5))-methyltransferase RlmD [Candidatus Woesearchaeota archaeon]